MTDEEGRGPVQLVEVRPVSLPGSSLGDVPLGLVEADGGQQGPAPAGTPDGVNQASAEGKPVLRVRLPNGRVEAKETLGATPAADRGRRPRARCMAAKPRAKARAATGPQAEPGSRIS